MIKFDKISLSFDGKEIFSGLDLEIGAGEKVVLSGRSGIGKSSLFGLVLGFVVPDSGSVFFEGVRVDEKSVWDLRRKVSYIDQDVSAGYGKVSDWLSFVSDFKANQDLDFGSERIFGLMDLFGMKHDLLEKSVSELSGGERQRMAIIVSQLLNRKVYLLDEVTSALDKVLKPKVAAFFMENPDWTVISVSHDPVWTESGNVKVYDMEAMEWKR